MEKISIQITDDHVLLRQALALLLNCDPRFNVVAEAGTGREAVEQVCRLHPQVVIMDSNLPDMSGVEATRQIRLRAPATRVLMLSIHTQWFMAQLALQKGASGYITKSSPQAELKEAIFQVAGGCRYLCQTLRGQLPRRQEKEASGITSLTPREMEIVQMVQQGATSKEIATLLQLSKKTVDAHRYNILKKLKLNSTSALVDFIHYYGLGSLLFWVLSF